MPGRLSRLPGALLLALLALWVAPLGAQTPSAPLSCPEDRELCVQADHTGGIDLKTGVARLDGNVRGIVRSRNLHFRGNSLTAFRDGGPDWVRLVLEQDVFLQQAERESISDRGVLEQERIHLTGNVRIHDAQIRITAQEAEMRTDINRTVVRGQPDAPVVIVVQRLLLGDGAAAESAAPPAGASADAVPRQSTTRLRAQQVVLDDPIKQMTLSGDVHIEQSDDQLSLDAQHVILLFTEASELESFRAEGDVVISQPDRRISSDFAQSRNNLETILLVGHATMQQTGQFDLKSDRMEVFTDSSKGIMQSQDRQRPITLTLDLAGGEVVLSQQHIGSLTQQGLPGATLAKLRPLVGKTYPTRDALRNAVGKRLSASESERYLDTIVAVTR